MSGLRLHLPDCAILSTQRYAARECDCGRPPGILPHNKTLVRRFRRGRVGLVVIPKSKLRDGEEDLNVSRLLFEADTASWIKQQLREDDRKAGLPSRGPDSRTTV